MPDSTVSVLFKFTDNISGGLKKVNKELEKVEKTVQDITKLGQNFTEFGTKIGLLGAALGAAFAVPVKIAADFEKSIKKVGAIAGATTLEFEKLTASAQELGRTTEFTAREASEGMLFLAQAGFEVNEIIGAMPQTLRLASIASLDLGTAADITSNILTGFGLQVEDLGRVNDVLVTAFTNANVNLQQLGEAMKFVGPVAKSAGVSIEETAAAVGLLGSAGIQGGLAGTSLRNAITRLLNPSREAKKVIEELGIEVQDVDGNFVGFRSIVKQFESSLASAGGEAEQTGLLMQVFGQRAGPAVSALIGQGSKALDEFVIQLENSEGATEKIYTTMTDTLAQAFKIFASALEGFLISVGTPFLEWLAKLFRTIAKGITAFTEFYEAMGPLATIATALVGVLSVLTLTIGGLSIAIGLLLTLTAQVLKGTALWNFQIKALTATYSLFTRQIALTSLITAPLGAITKAFSLLFTTIKTGSISSILAIKGVKTALIASGIGAIVVGIGFAIKAVYDRIGDTNKIKRSIQDIGDELGKQADATKRFAKTQIFYFGELTSKSGTQISKYKKDLQGLRIHLQALEAQLTAEVATGINSITGVLSEEAEKAAVDLLIVQNKLVDVEKGFVNLFKVMDAGEFFNFEAVRESLDTMNKSVSKGITLTNEKLDVLEEEYKDQLRLADVISDVAEKEIAQQQLRAEFTTAASKIIIENYNAQVAVIQESITVLDEQANKEKVTKEEIITGVKEIERAKRNLAKVTRNTLRDALDDALKKEKEYKKVVIRLTNDIADAERTLEDELREIKREGLSESKQIADIKLEQHEKLSAARQAFEQEDFDLAKKLAEDAQSLAKEFIDADKKNLEEGTQLYKESGELRIGILEAQKEQAQAFHNKEQENVKALKEALLDVDATLGELAKGLVKIGEKNEIEFTVDTTGALNNIAEIERGINELKQPTSSTHTIYVKKVETNRWGGLIGDITRFARGGKLSGYGGGDTVPSLLEKGEFVLRKEAVSKYGSGFIAMMNRLALPQMDIPKFALGGPVFNSPDTGSNISETFNFTFNGQTDNMPINIKRLVKELSIELERFKLRG